MAVFTYCSLITLEMECQVIYVLGNHIHMHILANAAKVGLVSKIRQNSMHKKGPLSIINSLPMHEEQLIQRSLPN